MQLSRYIPVDSTVIDLGCANGQFLFDISNQINLGVGIDKNRQMIEFAENKSKKLNQRNLRFRTEDIIEANITESTEETIAIFSLCLHEMDEDKAIRILNQYSLKSKRIIIADLCEPDTWFMKALLHIDEWIAGHHKRFFSYIKKGGIINLINTSNVKLIEEHKTQSKCIKIWICQSTM